MKYNLQYYVFLLLLFLRRSQVCNANLLNNNVNFLNNSLSVNNKVPLPQQTPADRGYNVLEFAEILENKFKDIRNNEFELSIIQNQFDSMQYSLNKPSVEAVLQQIERKLAAKLKLSQKFLTEMKDFIIENNFHPNTILHITDGSWTSPNFDDMNCPTCHANQSLLIYEDFNLIVYKKLLDALWNLQKEHWNSQRQYFLSTKDQARDLNLHFQSLYLSAIQNKHIVLLIDNGNSIPDELLKLSKSLAKYMVQMLTENDRISVIGASEKISTLTEQTSCNQTQYFINATVTNRRKLIHFIDNLNQSKEATNYTLGFNYSFSIIKEAFKQNNGHKLPIVFLYISRRKFTSIEHVQMELPHPISINTCMVMYENDKDHYTNDVNGKNIFTITVNTDFSRILTNIFAKLTDPNYFDEQIYIHLPYYDPTVNDVLISITQSIGHFGLLGADLFLSDLAEDVVYFRSDEQFYAFMIDLKGNTIAHPSFPRPLNLKEEFLNTKITFLEDKGFHAILKKMQSEITGSKKLNDKVYSWNRTLNFYIICLVKRVPQDEERLSLQAGQFKGVFENNLIYHRLDLLFPPQETDAYMENELPEGLCRHFRQLATNEDIALFLSPSAFKSSFHHLKNNDSSSLRSIQNVMAYLKETQTNLLANPGLLSEIRSDVLALMHIMNYYKQKHDENLLSKFIIRRYAATMNGVLEMYPAGQINTDFEPSKRPWFIKALEYPGTVIVTEPYLDAGGAGYIVSMASTISQKENNRTLIIVAIDFTLGYFTRLLMDSYSTCNEDNIRCFLMEDRGYLISHPELNMPGTNRKNVEHITHKESHIANDILNQKYFVTKKICHNFVNRTVQRSYQFNISLSGMMTNSLYGERTKYQIALVQGTNVFVGIVNSSNKGGAFCPCSTVDRLCLNCNRMEQTECECPCECPLEISDGICRSNVSSGEPSEVPICSPIPEKVQSMYHLNVANTYNAKPCTKINCEMYTTQHECLGLIGCEWCQVDIDTETMLNTPFCTSQFTCFNGILGYQSPYGDSSYNQNILDQPMLPVYSALAPVVGAILALCIVVAFVTYCYRQNIDQNGATDHLYADSLQDIAYPMSRFDFDDKSPDDDIIGSSAKQNLLLSNQTNQSITILPNISPYRMPSNYRRPNGDSDHGYSTMTPHEESEHLCITGENSTRRMSADSISTSTMSFSNPQNSEIIHPFKYNSTSPPLTKHSTPISLNNHIIARVQVHRNMETS